MKDNWVDFRIVKARVSMQAVLDHYNISGKLKKQPGNELRGACPLPDHEPGTAKNGFHVNLTKNAFNCFGCHGRGNILDLVAAMEGCTVAEAARKLDEWFAIGAGEQSGTGGENTNTGSALAPRKKRSDSEAEERAEDRGEPPPVNVPLKFQLKGIDPAHPYLAERGISKAIAELFGVGFFAGKGSMSGRIVIPIHNEHGELVAYAGRAVDESEPKYKFPAGFHKSLELFNLHRASAKAPAEVGSTVVLVEGFFDCIKVHQAGFPCVALMGSSLSAEQERLLRTRFTGAVLLFDGDEAGRECTDDCLLRLGRRLWIKAVVLPKGKQPDTLDSIELGELLKA